MTDIICEKVNEVDKIIYIYENVIYLSQEDKLKIAEMIKNCDPSLINECADGIRVAFKKMPEDLINQVYNFISYKVGKLTIQS